ncbi:M14 family zinc carboxypeptidase, partial [Hanstruepera flava]|uniref:M14 family zinc carboxypeptidase n=1 Tax=Hanstruepera flava TaxID=2930218 RepID=UPI0020298C50
MKLNYPQSKILLLFIVVIFSFINTFSQNRELQRAEEYLRSKGEVTFSFQIDNPVQLEQFSNEISILNYDPNNQTVYAWANSNQFRRFQQRGFSITVNPADNIAEGIIMSNQLPASNRRGPYPLTFPLTAYPTYADYELQMQEFANNHPDICELVDIGGTTEGVGGGDKRLLFIKLSDNISTDEAEPKLMYTSSIHGDEITGYPLMLNLINYFITAYKDTGHSDHLRIKNLIDNSEVWINPMANPDGTYYNNASNTSVANARRANANGLDLNRNYPDNVAGPHANGHTSYELETQHFMTLADNNHFVISANFHGGVEVVNYPWDNTYDRHADDDWYIHISREYADNCQADGPSGYMDYLNNGITHGADWYRVYGGRQDFMNYYHQCKETTIELSDVKLIPANQLVNHWNYNQEALIEYLIQGTYGFQGIVKDAVTGNPIEATITLVGHDNVNSHTVSSLPHGDYYRPVYAGTYDILFEADCYEPFTLNSQTIANYETKTLADVLLNPVAGSAPNNLAASNVAATTVDISWDAITGADYDYRYRVVGSPTWTTVSTSNATINLSGLTQNTQYEVQVRSTCNSNTSSYSASVLFTTTLPPPCSGTLIASFPYNEGFESGLGDWYQDTGDNFDWTRDSNGTPTNSTGPSSASEGTWYMYTEANGRNSQSAILNSPCFNLNGKSSASFTFDYSMYGNQMGSLTLQISINDGSSWSNIWTLFGNQGTGWNPNTIDLTPYVDNYVRLRFVGTPSGNRSDMAIDDIGLTAVDASITPIAVCKNITITLDAGGNASITPTDIDNGGSVGNLSIDISSFDCTNIGANNVTLTATDPSNSSNTDSCIAVVTVNQQAVPTPTNCWDNYVYNNSTCQWENTGTQPAEPATECWETATFNNTTCSWDVTGTQPAEPSTECWETATFNNTTCSWDVTGTQPAEPSTE